MSAVKLFVFGVVVASLVSVSAVLRQSTGVASSTDCAGCEAGVSCSSCADQGAILEEIVSSLENTTIVKVNIDDSPGLAKRFGISGIPALLLFRDGKLVNTHVGVADSKTIAALLAECEFSRT